MCGTITGFSASTATTPGSLTISSGGSSLTFGISPGVTLTNSTAINPALSPNVCLSFTLNGTGLILSGGFVPNFAGQFVICGPVTAFSAPGAGLSGSVTIAGITFPLAAGATLNGTPTVGVTQTAALVVNGLGGVSSGTVTAGTCATPTFQGAISAYTAATGTTAGSIVFNGTIYTIAAGSTLTVNGGVPLAASVPGGHAGLAGGVVAE